jgi:hypothetical protein
VWQCVAQFSVHEELWRWCSTSQRRRPIGQQCKVRVWFCLCSLF